MDGQTHNSIERFIGSQTELNASFVRVNKRQDARLDQHDKEIAAIKQANQFRQGVWAAVGAFAGVFVPALVAWAMGYIG